MKTGIWIRLGLAVAGTAGLMISAGCSNGQASLTTNETPAVAVEQAPDPHLVSVDKPERFSVVAAGSRREVNQLNANGVVTPDVSRTVPVNALSSGRVVEVHARLGDDVGKGDMLLTINSPDMSHAISDYRKFQADEMLAKTQLDRSQLLFSHGALAQKDLDVAEQTYTKAKVDAQAAADHIRILGGDPEHPSAVIELRAPISGTITEQNVTTAAGVKSLDNSPNLFTIADLSQVWLVCDVYENDLAQVYVGDRADIELNAYPGRKFPGRVANISKLLDPNTRTAKVRIELSNERGLLRPNMFATVHFQSAGGQNRTVVPARAVLRLHDRDWVFVKADENKFRRTEVQAGPVNADGTQQILSGLHPGDKVIGDALLFDREAQKE
jgi:cobalt-zinc-cadmium efflux system membrane fusion protein